MHPTRNDSGQYIVESARRLADILLRRPLLLLHLRSNDAIFCLDQQSYAFQDRYLTLKQNQIQ